MIKKIAIKAFSTLAVASLLALMCLPLGNPAHAAGGMQQLIIGGFNNALSNTETEYNSLGGGFTWTTSVANRKQVASSAGAFSNLAVELSAAPGNGGSYTITLLNVTQSTSLAVIIADPTTTNINTGTLSVNAGDVIVLQSTYADAPSATPTARWSVVFEGAVANESLILGTAYCRNNLGTRYVPIACGTNADYADETTVYQIIPTPGTIKNLYVVLSADPGSSPDAYRFTLRVNGVNSDDGEGNPLQVTIVAENTTGNDTLHEIPVLAGNYVSLMIEPLETPAVSPAAWIGFTFVADTDGESLILGQSTDTPTVGSTEYNYLTTGNPGSTWSATENYQGGQASVTLKKFYAMLSGTSAQNYTLNVRATSAGGNTGIAVTITAGNTTGNDTVNTYGIGNYDDLSISCLATAGGTARVVYWGLVCYIPAAVSPTVSSSAASDVEETSVTGNGNVTALGDTSITDRGFVWDTSSHGPPGDVAPAASGYANNWTENGSWGVGVFDSNAHITGLTEGELYYMRACAQNDAAHWGYGDEVMFLTKPNPSLLFVAVVAAATQIDMSWTVGAGADETYIRGKLGSAPIDRTDGAFSWHGAGVTTSHAGLNAEDHWYYIAWSYCTEGGLTQYSDPPDASADAYLMLPLAPTSFTLVVVGNTQIDGSWVVGIAATTTVVVRQVGRYPADITDGEEIYNGVGTSFSDMGLDAEENEYFYRAWSHNMIGYSVDSADDSEGGIGMVLIAFIVLALGLMGSGYAFKRQALVFGAVGAWLLLAAYSYTRSTTTWDVYYTLFWLSIGLVLVSALEAMFVGMKPEEPPPPERDSLDDVIEKQENYQKKVDKMKRAMGGGRRRRGYYEE